MSVQRSQSSVKPGQKAAYTVQVSTENNGSVVNVSVAIAAQPSSQKPAFTTGCAKGDGTATCTVNSVSDKQPATLHAQIPVASGVTSITSVKLTATASIVTSVKWTPPSAAETVAITAVPAAPTKFGEPLAGNEAAARAHPEPQQRLELARRRRQRVEPVPRDHPIRHAQLVARDPAAEEQAKGRAGL